MKKILLGTTTLIGAAGLFAGAALADTPKVTIGGYENVEWGQLVGDDLDAGQRAYGIRNDTQIDFKIDGKSDMGLGYGGEIDLLADVSPDKTLAAPSGGNASKTFIYLSGGNWGRIEAGDNVGADGAMKVDAGTIARATGGVDGDWKWFANSADQFLASGDLPLAYGAVGHGVTNNLGNNSEENISKITYYTPRFAGFQVGVSYLPDQINRGQGVGTYGPSLGDLTAGVSQNIWTGGIDYQAKVYQVGVDLAATGEYGKAELTTYENLKAWQAGGKLSYMGFSVAGSYGDWGKSNTLTSEHSKDTNYWTAGGAYETGPFGASVTYLRSQVDCGVAEVGAGINGGCASTDAHGKNKFDNVSVGADYKLAPGLTPYAEVSFYNENSVTAANDDKGAAVILGTQLNF